MGPAQDEALTDDDVALLVEKLRRLDAHARRAVDARRRWP